MRNMNLLDKRRSYLSSSNIKKYKGEITKQKNNPVCPSLSTIDVAQIGVDAMKKDKFCMVKEKIDV